MAREERVIPVLQKWHADREKEQAIKPAEGEDGARKPDGEKKPE